MQAFSERMGGLGEKRLVFRIGGVGFALSLENLVEIRDAGPGVLDRSEADPDAGLLGVLSFRDGTIRAISVRQKLGLPAPVRFEAAYVVVNGEEGIWALPVDRVDGIYPAGEFELFDLPLLLTMKGDLPYRTLEVRKSEPLISFDPLVMERFGGGA